MRVLTKSKYKLGLECPNKLYYAGKKVYANLKKEDSFLEALAQGGFQVEELARMHYPNGILVEGEPGEYEAAYNQTKELLKKENVSIYEAAFLVDGLFIRTDILVKVGNLVKLIEVKSKSFDPEDEFLLIGKRGGIVSTWKPYLFDVAFQKHVMQLCYPNWSIESYLMLADKKKKASIDGLNQLFRINKTKENRTGISKKVSTLEETGSSVLGLKKVTDVVKEIESDKIEYTKGLNFTESISKFKELYHNDQYANWPTSFMSCKNCEFKTSIEDKKIGLKSGFEECFRKQHKWSEEEFNKPNILDIYSFRRGAKLFQDGVQFKSELSGDLIGLKIEPDELTTSHRQWLQIEKEVQNDSSIYVNKDALIQEMKSWDFPLHFIDFETSAAALPFNKNTKPYEQIAFQFSHHIYNNEGNIIHATEYINSQAGEFPNFEFTRALKKALENDNGTIFRYSNHENSILNAIYCQLDDSKEADKRELMNFIKSISHSTRNSAFSWTGNRDMVDLWEVEKKYYYNPITKGSNSLKEVLPAALQTSEYLKNKYSRPIGEINITSKNFSSEKIWLKIKEGQISNPYDQLPPVFDNWNEEEIENSLSDIENIANGGAALTAYSKLQYTDMTDYERKELEKSLLKYCELDTLAMVMLYEHFVEITT
ncbi:DUF2779 domain-containing protein [Pareuzebyella sediminis]|uniref:DUF2779 domain-containing protein n=1 Tax=Pareuzebyella sediminis TaxID=2607998 RepID=UPI0011F0976C|nr:DUF2779 domain-containing protein [Pareuzebyella sediminis]